MISDFDTSKNYNVDITFCVPVYNAKSYLSTTIKTIVEQDYNGINYEILCIDDCSTDGSYEKLIELAEKYPTIRVLQNQNNSGISFTRNRLIREAYGKYIWYVDSDDLLFKNSVYYVFKEIENVQGDVIYCDYVRVNEDISSNDGYVFDCTKKSRLITDKEDLPCDLNGRKMNALWAGLFLREFLISNEIWFNEKVVMQEDTIFYWQFKMNTDKIYKIDCPVYLYRQRMSSISHEGDGKRIKEQYQSMVVKLELYEDWLANNFYDEKSLLEKKIYLTKQGIVLALASIQDTAYVKDQLKYLKAKKFYPYKPCWDNLQEDRNHLLNILKVLLPIEVFFWGYHCVCRKLKK